MHSLTPAILGAVVTVLGWLVTYSYSRNLEDRRRRREALIQHRAQQIEQLYGPLLSLIEQIFNVWDVQEDLLASGASSPERNRNIKEFVWQRYFTPLHKEIACLLRTKLYLLEGDDLPKSFAEYLKHATQEECQHLLWEELQIDTSGVSERPWPGHFHPEVKSTLKKLMDDRQNALGR